MIIFFIFLFMISFIIFIFSKRNLDKIKKIKIDNSTKEKEKEKLLDDIHQLTLSKAILENQIKDTKEVYKSYEKDLENYNTTLNIAKNSYIDKIAESYSKIEKDFDKKKKMLEIEFDLLTEEKQLELDKIIESISSGVQAQLREREIQEKTKFYQLYIPDQDLSDILKLEDIKNDLHQPVILSKLIWSTYFQKQVTALCNRVFGLNQKCGIYKLTDRVTQQCYIGQSVNIQERIKQHCKCGLGIDAPTTSKLYNAMKKDGIWNFTFELLEECKREDLNEKEKMWILIYQADKFGLNATKGNN